MVKIFLDLDGVLVNFVQGVCEVFEVDPMFWPVGQYDYPLDAFGVNDESQIYEHLDDYKEDFWIQLPLLPDARRIVALAEDLVGSNNVAFLSKAPSRTPEAASGKQKWVIKHFPEYRRRTFICAGPKDFVANVGFVLVDDYKVNVDAWTKQGGHGVLCPQRWNEDHHLESFSTLKERLERICTGSV